MGAIAAALQACHQRMQKACANTGRKPNEVKLLAVSKTIPEEAIREAWQAGQQAFGENYLQEALLKQQHLADLAIEWHFIGPIQSNKTRPLAEHFHWIHSVDRLKIAQRLSDARSEHVPPLNVLVQVNVSGEASKSGIAPNLALDLADAVNRLPRLRCRGFMTIPRPSPDQADQRSQFRILASLLQDAHERGLDLDTLSMGMSDDLEAAILEGSTLIRVGTAIFGARQYT